MPSYSNEVVISPSGPLFWMVFKVLPLPLVWVAWTLWSASVTVVTSAWLPLSTSICRSCRRVVRQCHWGSTVEHVINSNRWRYIVKWLVERWFRSSSFRCRIECLCHTSESVIHVSSADYHHVLVLGRASLGCTCHNTVLLHLHGSSETVNESNGLQVIVRMLDVVVLGHCVCRSGNATLEW